MAAIVTLCTDFGTADSYVAAMKGVILTIAPQATLVDISHDVARHSVAEAAFVLRSAFDCFPPGTVHLVIVDPGVGSARRGIAVRCGNHRFVAPDNGVLSYVLGGPEPFEAVALTQSAYWRAEVSHTFHGRDVFAPVAAHLANGVPLSALGPPVTDPVRLDLATPSVREDGLIVGQVIHVDHFGNLVTNIPASALSRGQPRSISVGQVTIAGLAAGPAVCATTYSSVCVGQLLALVGSHGYLEIAVREGSAAHAACVGIGAQVLVE